MARARVAVGAGALGLAAALVAYPARGAGDAESALWAFGAAGLVVLALGMAAALPLVVTLAVAALAAGYAIAAGEADARVDTRTAVWAAGLFVVSELAFLVVESRTAVLQGGELVARRLASALGLGVAAVLLGALLVVAAVVEPPGGLGVQVLGVLAAAGLIALVASLGRR